MTKTLYVSLEGKYGTYSPPLFIDETPEEAKKSCVLHAYDKLIDGKQTSMFVYKTFKFEDGKLVKPKNDGFNVHDPLSNDHMPFFSITDEEMYNVYIGIETQLRERLLELLKSAVERGDIFNYVIENDKKIVVYLTDSPRIVLELIINDEYQQGKDILGKMIILIAVDNELAIPGTLRVFTEPICKMNNKRWMKIKNELLNSIEELQDDIAKQKI